ncbi:SspB family protein [Beijerinckia indica]|uniref:Stringent starvation protein B n=1 Tax=Beijerinckia indica subsp. indica (strain ATCC 9039 / DSM 1715 / NCIMB 8712) TaxID=395963 RepID=B2IH07_BEII9|nr:ClpXP protease specificity-enhancing factor SspB [Beijerinckia indica]ACB94421.1 protein of unknown function DUF1321 [Beijerinckia indica subsp. indica ATCC 9039]
MAVDLIRYDLLVQDALRGVVRKVLTDAVREGLPGEHHFYITFRTHAPGVRLSAAMREQYPDEMTIILQHQFWDLSVNEQAFEVGLSFKGVPEILRIPFDAVTGFFDPSVRFALKFELEDEAVEAGANDTDTPDQGRPDGAVPLLVASESPAQGSSTAAGSSESSSLPAPEEAKVVSIDAFRKKT